MLRRAAGTSRTERPAGPQNGAGKRFAPGVGVSAPIPENLVALAWLWFWVMGIANLALAGFSLRASLTSYLSRRSENASGERAEPPDEPLSVCLFIPCADAEYGLEGNLESYLQQRYANYEVVFIVADGNDPAVEPIKRVIEQASRSRAIEQAPPARLFVAGPTSDQSQKVANLQRAVREFDDADVFAFADSDGRVPLDWLAELVRPLGESSEHHPRLTTGYRFYLPEPGGVAALLRSIWNAGVLSLLGDHDHNFAWGGSMAIRRDDFERCGNGRFWNGVVSDDYALTHAVRKAGGRVDYRPRCLVPSAAPVDLITVFRWCGRQLSITRVYWPALFRIVAISQILYTLFLVLGLPMALQHLPAMAVYAGVVALGWASAGLRIRSLATRHPAWGSVLREYSWGYVLLAPLGSFVSVTAVLTALASRRIVWRGFVYEMVSAHETKVIRRPDNRAQPPA